MAQVKPQTPPPETEQEAKEQVKERIKQGTGPTKKRDSLQKVEERLNEMFATIAMAQMALGLGTGDQRHVVGGNVTNELSPSLVHAWINLARENDAVRRVLLRMSETTAWGEVAITSVGFLYSQAQAYGAVPSELPNPWIGSVVPPSDEVADAEAQGVNGAPPQGFPAGKSPDDARSGVDAQDDPVHNEAERQRKMVEERRKQRGS